MNTSFSDNTSQEHWGPTIIKILASFPECLQKGTSHMYILFLISSKTAQVSMRVFGWIRDS